MKSDGPLKHFVLAFLLAVICYAFFYHNIEHRRTRKGPWSVTFTNDANGNASIVINQPRLAITNVQVTFNDQPTGPGFSAATLLFSQPRPVPYPVPLGKCVFIDTTFLPGTVTLELFNHEIELLPRVLVVDHQEHPWLSDTTITLHSVSTNPPAAATHHP
ncbi:MAG TPA: hypothetical protein VKY92_15130 [Verrucomicrobiae bacterium]|nr:hypothetical protein [Verrucomicrobiae bacterium]